MNKEKHRELEASGWKIGSVDEFLKLSQEETEFIELKLSLSQNLKERRQSLRLTQKDFARMIQSSQSCVAKMEAGDPAVSIDLLVKSLLALKECYGKAASAGIKSNVSSRRRCAGKYLVNALKIPIQL